MLKTFAHFSELIRDEKQMHRVRIEAQMIFRLRLPFHLENVRINPVWNHFNARIAEQCARARFLRHEFCRRDASDSTRWDSLKRVSELTLGEKIRIPFQLRTARAIRRELRARAGKMTSAGKGAVIMQRPDHWLAHSREFANRAWRQESRDRMK